MRTWDAIDWFYAAFLSVIMFVIVVAAINIATGTSQDDRIDSYRTHCVEANGHIYAPDIILCVTDDGRLVEVYP